MKILPLKKRRELARKYRRAAERIFERKERCCCFALNSVSATEHPLRRIFRTDALAVPDGKHSFWMETCKEDWHMPRVRERRIFALLWAAELIADGTVYRMGDET